MILKISSIGNSILLYIKLINSVRSNYSQEYSYVLHILIFFYILLYYFTKYE